MTNADEFLDCYNRIDKFLKEKEGFNSTDTFAQKIKNSKSKVVQLYKYELLSLGELRNAIVHNPRIGDRPIAEPHENIVEKLKEIYKLITNPEKVSSQFIFQIFGAKENDFINHILIQMKEKSFSQFPVFDEEGKVIELISSNTISRWLSANLDQEGTILIEKVRVKDLIPYIEFKCNYKFISMNTSVYDALDLFIEQIITKKRNIDVLFITTNGKGKEKPIGLITIEDIAPVMKNIGLDTWN